MEQWKRYLGYDAVAPLLESGNAAIIAMTQRDLLNRKVRIQELWKQKGAQTILRKQCNDGSWQYPAAAARQHIRSRENYNQLETYRNLALLVELYGFNKEHTAIEKAARYLWSFQSGEGDLRGIYGNQYTPNYTAAITEILIKAGYTNDLPVKRTLDWLLATRQNDGGWAIPFRTRGFKLDAMFMGKETVAADPSQPASWMITGVVLRAFAAYPACHNLPEVILARDLLLHSMFKRDKYPDRGSAAYWLRCSFPFWFTDVVSALDSLSQLGCTQNDEEVAYALEWLKHNQQHNGLWNLKLLKGRSANQLELWLSLAICRIFKRFYSAGVKINN